MHPLKSCALGLVLLSVALTACTDPDTTTTSQSGGGVTTTTAPPPPPPPPPPSLTPAYPTYRVPDTSCPDNYGIGLSITTDVAAEVQYLDDVVACTNATGTATYLENKSDAVWRLTSLGARPGRITRWNGQIATLIDGSFRSILSEVRTDSGSLMTPGGLLTVDLPPGELRWDLDLVLSTAWQGHDVGVEKIKSVSQDALIAALARKSPARRALATCTIGLYKTARDVTDLPDADFAQVMLTGLGAASATTTSRQAALYAPAKNEYGKVVTLSEEIGRLKVQGAVLDDVSTKLGYLARGAKVFQFIRFLVS